MAQPRYACALCGTWKCSACGWQRSGASTTYDGHFCLRCNRTEGTIRPTMHTAAQWRIHNGAEPDPQTAGVRSPARSLSGSALPETYRGVLVPKQGPYQRLDFTAWRRGVDDALKYIRREESS